MIGVDPDKGSYAAVVIGQAERTQGQVRVRAGAAQAQRLLGHVLPGPSPSLSVMPSNDVAPRPTFGPAQRDWSIEATVGPLANGDWKEVLLSVDIRALRPYMPRRSTLRPSARERDRATEEHERGSQ